MQTEVKSHTVSDMSHLKITQYTHAQDYDQIFNNMQRAFKNQGHELWLLEHLPVYTLGKAASSSHLLQPTNIPVVRTDRGGQVTYHGPGQLIAYTLFNLNDLGIGIRTLVTMLENSIIKSLSTLDIDSFSKKEAPGVYVTDKKIASVGLKVRHGLCYHGLSLNVNMDLSPFNFINPCGFKDLKMIQCSDFIPEMTVNTMAETLSHAITEEFHFTSVNRLII